MTEKKKCLMVIAISAICLAIFTVTVLNIDFYGENNPAQVEQVEVAGKRTTQYTSTGKRGSKTITNYYVTFKFSDGSAEEFEAGRPNVSKYYDAMNEGDTGQLTYKVSARYPGGRLVSFEKDTGEGVLRIEPYRRGDTGEKVQIIFSAGAILLGLLLILWILAVAPDMDALKKRPKQTARVEVVGKRRAIFAFRFPDGSIKELVDPHASIKINDTGMLIYKEREDIEQHIKKEKVRFRGRLFIGFKKDTKLERFKRDNSIEHF